MVANNVAAGRLSFTTDTEAGVDHGEVVFIAVPTPPNPDRIVFGSNSDRVKSSPLGPKIRFAESAEDATDGAEALIVATEWPEFANANFAKVKEKMIAPLLFDGRNLLDPEKMRSQGFEYHGIGRGDSSVSEA